MTWRNRAACLDEDPELFFPIGNTGPALLQIEEAKGVCRRCTVVETCLNGRSSPARTPESGAVCPKMNGAPSNVAMPGPVAPASYTPSLTDLTDLIDRSRATNRTVVPCGFRAAPGNSPSQLLNQRGDNLGAQAGAGRVEPLRQARPVIGDRHGQELVVLVATSHCPDADSSPSSGQPVLDRVTGPVR